MKALQLTEPKKWAVIDINEPPSPGPGEAVVRIHRVGVCGTDISGFLGKMPFFSYPRIPGHELGVEVVAIGDDVANVTVGQSCCVEPYINCQQCFSCVRGFTNCCETHQTLGVMCDGGLTRLMTLPARKLHPSDDLTMDQAALVETLAIGCHAVDRSGLKQDETALIIGAGPIGLSALEFAKLTGARVIVADLSESRLRFVRDQMGIADTLQVGGDEADVRRLEELTEGRRADVVIDATGHNGSMVRAMEMTAFAGRLVYVGITQQELSFPQAPFFHRRELTLLASRNAPSRDFPRIIDLIATDKIDTDPWITHHAAFDDVPRVFESFTKPESGVIKAIIEVTS